MPGGRQTGLALCLVFLGWANVVTPMWSDDYCHVIAPSLSAAAAAAWQDYFTWSGRFLANVVTYATMSEAMAERLGGGSPLAVPGALLAFDGLNALIFVALIRSTVRLGDLAGGRDPDAPRGWLAGLADILFAALLLWWAPRSVAEAALWKNGAICYLWPVAAELFVLEQALSLVRRGRAASPWLMAPVAAVAASVLEPISAVLTLALAALAWRAWRRGERLRWLLAVLMAHAAGGLFLALSPGSFARAGIVAARAPSPVADRAAGVFASLGKFADGYMLAGVALLALAYWLGRRRIDWRAGWGWLLPVLALLYAATLFGVPRSLLAARVTYPGTVLVACYVIALFLLRPVGRLPDRCAVGLLAALAAISLAVMVPDLRFVAGVDRGWTEQLARTAPGSDVRLPILRGRHGTRLASRHWFFAGFEVDPTDWTNRCYAHAWRMASVAASGQHD